MDQDLPVAAVILAAGRSARLGKPKQMLPLGDHPLIAYVVHCVRMSAVEHKCIVLGHAADEIRDAVNLDDFQVIENKSYVDGQGSSVQSAVAELTGKVSAIIFVLGDQPLQSSEIIDKLLESYQESPAPIIQPRFSDGPGNPVLLDQSLFEALSQLRGDTGARPILREQHDSIRFIDASDQTRPADVDTWDDYERLQRQYAGTDVSGES